MRYNTSPFALRQPRFPHDPFGVLEFFYQEEERQRLTTIMMEIIEKRLRPLEAWVEREILLFQWSIDYAVWLPAPPA